MTDEQRKQLVVDIGTHLCRESCWARPGYYDIASAIVFGIERYKLIEKEED
jgi:hypothetical protein